jgi:hypothetical protein
MTDICIIIDDGTSAKEAHTLGGLEPGYDYYIMETDIPTGYCKAKTVHFTFTENGTITIEEGPGKVAEDGTLLITHQALKGDFSVSILAVDAADDGVIEGAGFRMDENGIIMSDWTSTKEAHTLGGLISGMDYYITEKVIPAGYCKAERVWFTFSENGKITIEEGSGKVAEDGTILILHEKTSVSILAVDETNAPLSGAELQILDASGTAGIPIYEWVSSSEAYTVEGLSVGGNYIIQETAAPKGYAVPANGTFIINEDGTTTYTGSTDPTGTLLVEHEKEGAQPAASFAVDPASVTLEASEGYDPGTIIAEFTVTNGTGTAISFTAALKDEAMKEQFEDPAVDGNKITVQPKAGLKAGTYTATVVIADANGQFEAAEVTVTFKVGLNIPPNVVGETTYQIMWHAVDPMNVSASYVTTGSSTEYKMIKADITSVFIPPNTILYTAEAVAPDGTVLTDTITVTIPQNDSDPHVPTYIPIPPKQNKPVGDQRPTNDPVLNNPVQNPPSAAGTPEKPAAADKPSSFPFKDVTPSDAFYNDVKYVFENGIMNGVTTTEFAPNSTLTRGMIVTILYRVEGKPAASFSGAFSDVPAGTWHSEAVEWAASKGIVNGYGDGNFGPTDPVTREQLAAILFRYAQFKGYDVSVGEDTNILSYNDAFTWGQWAVSALQWACGAGVVEDAPVGMLRPTEAAIRSEIAKAIHVFCEEVAK